MLGRLGTAAIGVARLPEAGTPAKQPTFEDKALRKTFSPSRSFRSDGARANEVITPAGVWKTANFVAEDESGTRGKTVPAAAASSERVRFCRGVHSGREAASADEQAKRRATFASAEPEFSRNDSEASVS